MKSDLKATTVDEIVAWVTRMHVNEDDLAKFDSEEDFLGVAVELLKEVTSYVAVAASVFRSESGWTREQAAISGHFVRLYKLMHGLLDQICQRRGELIFVFSRLISEGLINVRFFMKNYSPELVTSYIMYSLQHEKRLEALIQKNIKDRGGQVLPIEDRMLKSIHHTAEKAGISLEEIPTKRVANWGDASIFAKADDVGLRDLYLGMIGSPSNSIHGNWQEIAGYHLDWDETNDVFTPRMSWLRPRPQIPLSLSQVTVETLVEFFDFITDDKSTAEEFFVRLSDLQSRLMAVQANHEKYIQTKTWPET